MIANQLSLLKQELDQQRQDLAQRKEAFANLAHKTEVKTPIKFQSGMVTLEVTQEYDDNAKAELPKWNFHFSVAKNNNNVETAKNNNNVETATLAVIQDAFKNKSLKNRKLLESVYFVQADVPLSREKIENYLVRLKEETKRRGKDGIHTERAFIYFTGAVLSGAACTFFALSP
jgi:hypothetical protein